MTANKLDVGYYNPECGSDHPHNWIPTILNPDDGCPASREQLQSCVDAYNALAGLNVANGELKNVLQGVDELIDALADGAGIDTVFGIAERLGIKLYALRRPAPATPAVAKQIDEFIKDLDA